MALDRQSIEKQDFPVGRRGYDQEAVAAHLKRVADEVEALRGGAAGGSTIAATASQQVQAVIAAAEAAATNIREEAQREAERMRTEARKTAEAARAQAATEARDHLARLSESLASLQKRAQELEAELGRLVSTEPEARTAEARTARVASSPDPASSSAAAVTAADDSAEEAVAETPAEPEPVLEPDQSDLEGAPEPDLEGARLTALNMALNGSPREEVERHLAENFSLRNPASLVDEVYTSVGG